MYLCSLNKWHRFTTAFPFAAVPLFTKQAALLTTAFPLPLYLSLKKRQHSTTALPFAAVPLFTKQVTTVNNGFSVCRVPLFAKQVTTGTTAFPLLLLVHYIYDTTQRRFYLKIVKSAQINLSFCARICHLFQKPLKISPYITKNG